MTITLTFALAGCGGRAPSPKDEPMRYKTTDKLRGRLEQVAQYGDGGSSLGGIPESIEELTKKEPEKGKKLLADFQKLNTATDKESRKKIAKEMAEQLK